MKTVGIIIRVVPIITAVLVILILIPGRSYSWAPATHAHMEKQFYKQQGKLKQLEKLDDFGILNNRIYGATALDIFNFSFIPPYPQCSAYLHDTENPNFLKVWDALKVSENASLQRAFAYGFVGHNNTWGMDSTAHISGITYGRGEGYVIAKASMLVPLLRETDEFKGEALTSPADARNNIAGFLAGMGAQYLGLPADSLLPVVTVGLEIAMDICASDFEREIKASTGWVNGKLSSNGIFW